MKYLLALLLLCSTVSATVTNTGTTRRDSVSMAVVCLDSTGKPSTCDSFFVRVMNNSANAVLFSDSGTIAITGMDSISGKSEYYFHRLVADIDGDGTDGEYILSVVAKKNAGSGWTTPNSRIFQIQNNIVADSFLLKRFSVTSTTDDAVLFSTSANSKWGLHAKGTGTGFNSGGIKGYGTNGNGILGIVGTGGNTHSGGISAGDSSGSAAGLNTWASSASGGLSSASDDATNPGAYGTTAFLVAGGTDCITNTMIGPSAIGASELGADCIGTSELSDEAIREIMQHAFSDTTSRLSFVAGGANADSVIIPSVTATTTSLPDSVQANIARHVWDRTADTTYPAKSWGDTLGKAALNVVTYLGSAPLKPGDTDELRNNIVTALGIPLKPSDTDELRANIIAAIPVEWTAAQRDSAIARILANRDSVNSVHLTVDTVRDTANADIALDRLQATAANLIKVIDSVNAILDTLQNVNSALRVDTATGGGGGGEVWTTAQRDSIIDRVLKIRDSVNGIIDSLQNLSSTLRLAGSDLDTVYQTVLCNDTIGGDFLLTLADYRAQIKRKFGVSINNTTWETDTVLNQLIREAIVTVNPIMRGYKTTKVMVSRFDSSDYPLDSLVGISAVLWHKNDTARSIPYLAREKWATLATQTTWGGDDPYLERPQVYDYTDNEISFFPVPTSEDTIKIYGWSKIPNITVVSSVAQIPQKYRIAVLKYATFLVARAKQHPMLDTFLNEYKESLVFLVGMKVEDDKK